MLQREKGTAAGVAADDQAAIAGGPQRSPPTQVALELRVARRVVPEFCVLLERVLLAAGKEGTAAWRHLPSDGPARDIARDIDDAAPAGYVLRAVGRAGRARSSALGRGRIAPSRVASGRKRRRPSYARAAGAGEGVSKGVAIGPYRCMPRWTVINAVLMPQTFLDIGHALLWPAGEAFGRCCPRIAGIVPFLRRCSPENQTIGSAVGRCAQRRNDRVVIGRSVHVSVVESVL